MHTFILWCGFFGAWLLVAGPLYQAALELDEQEIRREDLESVASKVPPPERVSAWRWLLPPVGYILNHRRSNAHKQAVFASMTAEQRKGFARLVNKATGWLFVSGGALLIATKETWELAEHNEWPDAVFWILILAMALLAAFNTAFRMRRTEDMQRAA